MIKLHDVYDECGVISYEYVYVFGGRYNSFYHFALFNLVLGLSSIFIEIQEVQMMNGIYGDMTLYGHATILGDNKSIYRSVTISVQAIYISFWQPYRYIRLDCITF